MAFPADMPPSQQRRLAVLAFLVTFAIVAIAAVLAIAIIDRDSGAEAQTIREYDLEVVPADIDYGDGNVWHAWTYKLAGEETGTVPGPTLHAIVGEKLIVHVTNKLDIVHSFHTHLTNYPIESDGSQVNVISGKGAGAMIPPGATWTYEFDLTEPGIFYYHCHSADGGHHITDHIHQGLYGAIVVHAPDEPKMRDEVVFMSEMGFDTEGDNVPPYIMNGLGLPGGEHTLEQKFHDGGIDAVAAELNKTVPAIFAEAGETMRLHVINIGDATHSWHAHSVSHISLGALRGQPWPANLVPLVPGQADTLQLTFTQPGMWLFHCHVVAHADAGMIGLFMIEDPAADDTPAETPEAP